MTVRPREGAISKPRRRRVVVAAWLSTAVLIFGGGFLSRAMTASAAEITDGLQLWYKLDETSGTVAADSSGHSRNAAVIGRAGWTDHDGLTFNGTDTYVKMPDSVLSGMNSITVATDVFLDSDLTASYFVYGFGNTSSDGMGNGYLFSTGDAYRATLATGNWATEQNIKATTSRALTHGAWKHITFTLTGGTGVIYEDGVEVGRATGLSITPGAIGGGTTTANYLGKSAYTADKLLKGKLKDFRVYDRALAADEVAHLAQPITDQTVAADKAALTVDGLNDVTENLALPTTAPNGSAVSWASSDPSVISSTGAVTRPAAGRPDAGVTLTATLTKGNSKATRTFTATVRSGFDDSQKATRASAALVVHNIEDVRGNLTLPTKGLYDTTVTWVSDRPNVVSTTGEVHRPAAGGSPVTVVLIAKVRSGQAESSRTFTAKVPPLPAEAPLKGYMFSYFTGEGSADGEQIYFGLSKGNDPLNWRELNSRKPVLTTTQGTKGVRDPFIIRSPEGDKFFLIATDLKIFGNGDWGAAQRTGSKSIMVWESTDLTHWTNQRLVKISPDTAGDTWAPEAIYDPKIGAYVVFWASTIYAESDPDHTIGTHNRMLYATTRDFHTFSEPKVWNDPGFAVIDSTVIQKDGVYYRFTKDERNNSSSTPCSKFITMEKSTDIHSTDFDFVADCIGKGTVAAGEGPLVFKSNTEDKWYLFVDEFGGRGYTPFETTDLAGGKWTASSNFSLPSSPRHGTVLPVTQAEFDRLQAAFPAG